MTGFVQSCQTLFNGVEGNAVLLVLVFLPARAQTKNRSSAGDVIKGCCHLGQHGRVTVGVACNQGTHAQAWHLGS